MNGVIQNKFSFRNMIALIGINYLFEQLFYSEQVINSQSIYWREANMLIFLKISYLLSLYLIQIVIACNNALSESAYWLGQISISIFLQFTNLAIIRYAPRSWRLGGVLFCMAQLSFLFNLDGDCMLGLIVRLTGTASLINVVGDRDGRLTHCDDGIPKCDEKNHVHCRRLPNSSSSWSLSKIVVIFDISC